MRQQPVTDPGPERPDDLLTVRADVVEAWIAEHGSAEVQTIFHEWAVVRLQLFCEATMMRTYQRTGMDQTGGRFVGVHERCSRRLARDRDRARRSCDRRVATVGEDDTTHPEPDFVAEPTASIEGLGSPHGLVTSAVRRGSIRRRDQPSPGRDAEPRTPGRALAIRAHRSRHRRRGRRACCGSQVGAPRRRCPSSRACRSRARSA